MDLVKANPLELYALNYLIGVEDDSAIEVPASMTFNMMPYGRSPMVDNVISYGNFFDERKSHRYQPYVTQTETARAYGELVPNENGPGFMANIRDQVEVRLRQGYHFMELDNAEAFSLPAINSALHYCMLRKIGVVAKNAFNLCEEKEKVGGNGVAYLANANIFGCVVELDSGTPVHYNALRCAAQKPNLPIWFVGFGDSDNWHALKDTADMICKFNYHNMSVSWSRKGEYETAQQILRPNTFRFEPNTSH